MLQNVTVFEDEVTGMVRESSLTSVLLEEGTWMHRDMGPADTQTCTWMVTAALFSPQNLKQPDILQGEWIKVLRFIQTVQ